MLSPKEMQALERRAFAAGADAEALMEEAGLLMAAAVTQFCPRPGRCLAFFGKGHNGGDALVAARVLSEAGWSVALVPAFSAAEWAPLTARKWSQAGRCETRSATEVERWRPPAGTQGVIMDGLLGIGAHGPLKEPVRKMCRQILRLREASAVRVFALDIPTGLDGETGRADPDAVVADVTLTVGFAKKGLVVDGAERFVGRLAVLPLEALSAVAGPHHLLECATPASLASFWKRRPADAHKGDCGRVTLVAGAIGTVGASVLAAKGALRAGAGLVTLCVSEEIFQLAAVLAPVECMVRPFVAAAEVLLLRADALGIGPGLGRKKSGEVLEIMRSFCGPAVLDADALNTLADGQIGLLKECAGPRLLTPHPGEMERLDPEGVGLGREARVRQFTDRWPVTLLLKGARTLVGTRGQGVTFNTTGNSGMASGGMGDVLTGVCAALLAQGLPCHEAGALGAWLCGRAAEVLVGSGNRSEESLLASDVAEALGEAFHALRERGF
jgi:ADP-dependent NAD(P)H-hydrate dehydratase / NAD(P)H-hydrate epimerase